MLSPRFIALCLIIHGALARPSIAVPQLKSIPADAAKLAYDADRRVTIAYDLAGHVMGEITASSYEPQLARRDAGTCANVNTDDVQRRAYFAASTGERLIARTRSGRFPAPLRLRQCVDRSPLGAGG